MMPFIEEFEPEAVGLICFSLVCGGFNAAVINNETIGIGMGYMQRIQYSKEFKLYSLLIGEDA